MSAVLCLLGPQFWGAHTPLADDLKEHLKLIKAATTEDLDELLHDLLVRVYPSKKTQDS